VVYEINTNPFIGHYVPDPKPLRRETQTLARQRFADALEAIDTKAQELSLYLRAKSAALPSSVAIWLARSARP